MGGPIQSVGDFPFETWSLIWIFPLPNVIPTKPSITNGRLLLAGETGYLDNTLGTVGLPLFERLLTKGFSHLFTGAISFWQLPESIRSRINASCTSFAKTGKGRATRARQLRTSRKPKNTSTNPSTSSSTGDPTLGSGWYSGNRKLDFLQPSYNFMTRY